MLASRICWCEDNDWGGHDCEVAITTWDPILRGYETSAPCPTGPILPDQPRLAWGELIP